MKNGDMPAMPLPLNPGEQPESHGPYDGLTKREYFAAIAMQGLLASGGLHRCDCVRMSVEHADALMKELEKGDKDD